MAKITYNGMELEEVTEPQIFDPPRRCVVWDDEVEHWKTADIVAFLASSSRHHYRAVSENGNHYVHCAIIPEKPAPRRATWLELAKWCANGNGLVYDSSRDKIDTGIMFKPSNENEPVTDEIKVRKWADTEWHEPDVEYMGIETNNQTTAQMAKEKQ